MLFGEMDAMTEVKKNHQHPFIARLSLQKQISAKSGKMLINCDCNCNSKIYHLHVRDKYVGRNVRFQMNPFVDTHEFDCKKQFLSH